MSSALTNMFRAWESVVLERDAAHQFRILTTPPDWLAHFTKTTEIGTAIEPGTLFPYLDNFLFDAEAFWSGRDEGRRDSAPWIESDAQGREWPLEASAVYADGTALLLLRHLGASFERHTEIMQAARNNLLAQERLEQEVQRRTRKILEREEELVFRMLAAAGFRDKETGAHIRRIGLYSEEMARALGWDERQVRHIRLAAPMHDLGKIGIPDSVLLKPDTLDDAERDVMRGHTEMGGRMLDGSDIAVLKMGAEIARCHHERWDGAGYPRGLKDTQIPESARIVSIVDVYDAMVHARVYKAAVPEDEVLDMLRAESGRHFDPQMVDLFLQRVPKMREIRTAVPDETPEWAAWTDT